VSWKGAHRGKLRLGRQVQGRLRRRGRGQFGSGWCWLVKDSDGALKVTKTENGVNPLCFGQTALLGCDVWEHSYYIDFRNKRPAYLTNFLDKLVNWENVASRM
jgi:Fe-Mn family superoxide dismutase